MFTPLADQLMVQQQVSNSWEHFVGVIMLNLTNRKQVKQTLPEFLYWFPQPYNLLKADPEFVKTILRPLGMVNVRYTRLIGMTTDYLDWMDTMLESFTVLVSMVVTHMKSSFEIIITVIQQTKNLKDILKKTIRLTFW